MKKYFSWLKHPWESAKELWSWLCKVEPQGLGTLMLGIAALVALWNSAGVLDKILEVQLQAGKIESAVGHLKSQSDRIERAIDLLGVQLRNLKARQTVFGSPYLMNEKATKQEIEEVIRTLPMAPTQGGQPTIYLPKDRIEETVNHVFKAKTPEERSTILENFLEIDTMKD